MGFEAGGGVPKIWLKGRPGKKILGVKGASPK